MFKKFFIVMTFFLVIVNVSESKISSPTKNMFIAAAVIVPLSLVSFSVYRTISKKEPARNSINNQRRYSQEFLGGDNNEQRQDLLTPKKNEEGGAKLMKGMEKEIKERIAKEKAKDESNPKINFNEFKRGFHQKIDDFVNSEMPKNTSEVMKERFKESVLRDADDKLYQSIGRISNTDESDRDDLMNNYFDEIKKAALIYRGLINDGEKLRQDAEKAEETYMSMIPELAAGRASKQQVEQALQLFTETSKRSTDFQLMFAGTMIRDEQAQQQLKDLINFYNANPAEKTTLLTKTVSAEDAFRDHMRE